jgi:predicted lipoprotein with Yx(FWY)xxD motif
MSLYEAKTMFLRARSGRWALAGLPLGVALAVAGCGSSSSSTATRAAANASTSSTTTIDETKQMTESGSMAMGHGGGRTAASMLGVAMTHPEVTAGSSSHYGSVLYDKDHFVLYTFSADHGSTSTCYGECATAWPPLLAKDAPSAGTGLNGALLGTSKRNDGSLQVTYGGHPLYYWSGDTAGAIMCQHVQLHGGFWYVVNPDGAANMAKGVGTMSAMGGQTSMSHGAMSQEATQMTSHT